MTMATYHSIIDLGTNNIQLLIVKDKKNPQIVVKDSKISELGKNFINNYLDERKIENAKAILKSYIKLSRKYTDSIIVIGTSISREAKNINIISEWLKKENVIFKIISGEEEAKLNGLANIDDFSDNIILFDIGGGSTEFTFIKNKKIEKNLSLKLGIRRLDEAFCNIAQKREYTKKELAKLPEPDFDFEAVGIGGTVTSLAFLKNNMTEYHFDLIHKSILTKNDVKRILDDFLTIHTEKYKDSQILKMFSLELLATGTMIVYEILDFFNKEKFFVSDKGLMFGVLNDPKYKF